MSAVLSARELPGVWPAHALATPSVAAQSTGFAALDAELPGGGWPEAGLVELLLPAQASQRWLVLLPALAARLRQHSGPLVLIGAPALLGPQSPALVPFSPALAAQGLPAHRLLCVNATTPAQRLWACEQALRCADTVAVVAWLPQREGAQQASALRRLHVGAVDYGKPVFVLRSAQAQQASSPAPLRLEVVANPVGIDGLQVRILKRRGPPLRSPLALPSPLPRLDALLRVRQGPARGEEKAHVLAGALSAA
ncbi:MAG: translesion DNA synthesis-associated protein ImuA [Rhodoferax sp.]|nr:translesion DNA synthesis-associated protein ImuA [Rhodoferax sp.]